MKGIIRAATAAAIAVLTLPVALDALQLRQWRADFQDFADRAASQELGMRFPSTQRTAYRTRALAQLADEPYPTWSLVEYPPREGAYRGRKNAVRVRVAMVRSPFFSSYLGASFTIRAESTFAILPRPPGCPGIRLVRAE